MKEDLLYFIWKFKFYKDYKIYDCANSSIQILNPGVQNLNSGPDFTEVQLMADEVKWAGNLEIDVNSSDWYKHGHHLNKDFNNVVLQVVNKYDKEVFCENGRKVPVMEIKVENKIRDKYDNYLISKTFVPCSKDIIDVDQIKIHLWLGNVLISRLNERSLYISKILESVKNSWEETFYQLLARSFGFNVNSDPFEWLAKSVPLKYLAKHHDNLFQIEALLFGQAGFLSDEISEDEYYNTLKKEYDFLKSKYQLVPLEKHIWKFMRIRPSNFPTIRISQLANLVFKSNSLFSKIIKANSVDEIRHFFEIKASEFWNNHFQFNKESEFITKNLGQQSVDKILINTVIPIIFVYGNSLGDEMLKEKAINFLEQIRAEKNRIIELWIETGIDVPSAFYSQALLHQKKYFCEAKKCLECGIGIEIMKKQFLKSS